MSVAAMRVVGALLLALVLLPWYRLTATRASGPSVDQTLRFGREYLIGHWWGVALGLLLTVVLGRVLRPSALAAPLRVAERWLLRPAPHRVGLALGALAAAAALAVGVGVLRGRPILLDGVSQIIQARYFAAGPWSGPELPAPEFWQFQFMVSTGAGWVSQYPPGFALALAGAEALGLPWLLGPLLLGLSVYLLVPVADRLLPRDRASARLGVLFLALSPFLAFHAGTYMNHVLALALVATAFRASLQAVDGSWAWAAAAGAVAGALLATRPWVAVVLGPLATIGVWACVPRSGLGRASASEPPRMELGAWLRRLGAAAAGAAPFVIALLGYNARLFGSPFRFGYVAAAGPSHGLGFHVDPWGNPYGPLEALGHTSADLLGLGADLLQTPIPAVPVVALYLLWKPVLDRGLLVVGLWALVPLAANALYWHHDLFMGPRLLYEAAPAWCLLLAAACVGVARRLPDRAAPDASGGVPAPALTRTGFTAALAVALLVALAYASPAKLASYAATAARSDMGLSAPRVDRPSLVFVHDSWESRLGSRLSAMGFRLDSARAALRWNSTCEVELYVSALEAGGRSDSGAQKRAVDLRFDAGAARAGLRELVLPSGSRMLTYPGEVLDARCERQAASDYAGVVSLPPLLWQGDLPGLEPSGAMFVRDHGPERNARLLELHPDRAPAALVRRGAAAPALVPYERGMEELWSQQR